MMAKRPFGREGLIQRSATRAPRISVLVAVKNAGTFLPGCLESLCAQTVLDQTEILLLDGNPSGGDRRIAGAYRARLPALRYLAVRRPGLYRAWNHGVRASRGRYLTNLNADDRLAPDALEKLAGYLDRHPAVALAYADSYVTRKPRETFERNSSRGRTTGWPDYSRARLLVECICGPHPMWRKAVHRAVGYFDESFVSAGDYEFWLRISERFRLSRVPGVVGLYYRNPRGLSIAGRTAARKEALDIKRRYLSQR